MPFKSTFWIHGLICPLQHPVRWWLLSLCFKEDNFSFSLPPPQLQLPKSCDGVTEGHPLTVRLMRSEMPWVGLAARTVVTVAGCVPWFLGEGNRNTNSSVQRFWFGRTWLGLQICISDIFLKWFWSNRPVIFPCTGPDVREPRFKC